MPLPLITDGELVRDVPDPVVRGSGGTPGVFPMCWPGQRSQAGAMNTNTVNPEARLHAGPPFRAEARRAALRRPVQDSVVAGVAGSLIESMAGEVISHVPFASERECAPLSKTHRRYARSAHTAFLSRALI